MNVNVGYCLVKNTKDIIPFDGSGTNIGKAKIEIENQSIVVHTGSQETVCNGYKLLDNSKYNLKTGDLLRIDGNKYLIQSRDHLKVEISNEMSKKITSFFKPMAAKNICESPFSSITGNWEFVNNSLLIFTPNELQNFKKIAAFDLDGTLIRTQSGKKFAEDANDWTLAYSTVCKELLNCYTKDLKLVIFTNQLPLNNDSSKQAEFKEKIHNILQTIKLPVQVFAAMKKDLNRKPCTGMWQCLEMKNGMKIDLEKSFFVGDAAGRPKSAIGAKDHSYADLLFAKNVGIKFHTPEEFFLKSRPVALQMPPFDPVIPEVDTNFQLSDRSEVVLMVGPPGSGKSTFCSRFLVPEGYVYVNRDSLGSWQNCAKLVEDSLRDKQKVVVDNTNRDRASRKRFVEIAEKYGVPVRCFVVSVDKNRAMHNNKFRELINSNHVVVSDIIIHSFYKNFEEPSLDEGFAEVVNVSFGPLFKSDEHRKLYNMHLLEKYNALSSSL